MIERNLHRLRPPQFDQAKKIFPDRRDSNDLVPFFQNGVHRKMHGRGSGRRGINTAGGNLKVVDMRIIVGYFLTKLGNA